MGLIDGQKGLTAAAAALALSPDARRIARRGLVYGMAGTLKVGDVVAEAARGAVRGAQAGLAGERETGVPTRKAAAP
jgi:hypothetical protein